MAKIPTMDEMAKQLAEKTLDAVYYNDKSLREWMKIIASEDAISKAEVIALYDEYRPKLATHVSEFGDKLKAIPPVMPTSSKMEQVEDCVSKAEVIKLIDKHTNDDGTLDDDITCILEELPPIRPKAKAGKWENGNPICPCCGEDKFKNLDADIWADWQPKYCPNCGAKMEVENEKQQSKG